MNQKNMIAIITHSQPGEQVATTLCGQLKNVASYVSPGKETIQMLFETSDALIFIGALGICVRTIAPFIQDKKTDPAVINLDANGQYVQPVLSGHVGGANQLAKEIAAILGAIPVLTTVSDTQGFWPLDLLPQQYGWQMEPNPLLTRLMAAFVNRQPTALLLEARDQGTLMMETETPKHVTIHYARATLDESKYQVVIAVTPFIHDLGANALFFRPRMVVLGVGCQKGTSATELQQVVHQTLAERDISPRSVSAIGSCELKQHEPALLQLADSFGSPLQSFASQTLNRYDVPNPSKKVNQVTDAPSVAEASAMHLSNNQLHTEKTKLMAGNHHATLAIALVDEKERKGMIEIVGAGPGDPSLVTVRGKQLLQTADLILYAGSLVPVELTHYAKPGCLVRSSADMDLQQQIDLMKSFYDRHLLVVRLHTGDPCIYGAIQEQMNRMDQLGMRYRITPGVSSFQAAAAALKSQFTIPEEVQSIILTRGEGRTPMPEKEQLHLLAQSQSTMCIYLSATLAGKVQEELMVHYPAETPVAICHKLTWKEERIIRCELHQLETTMKQEKLTMTTLIVVGKAIDNRSGESKLYHKNFKHAFRP
ncbi:MAG: precorrin-4 C(11)-methyltransferase [Breznakibacter sp.]